jgi:hypothetical protein
LRITNPRRYRLHACDHPTWNVACAEARHDRRVQNLARNGVWQNRLHPVACFDLHAPIAQRNQQ